MFCVFHVFFQLWTYCCISNVPTGDLLTIKRALTIFQWFESNMGTLLEFAFSQPFKCEFDIYLNVCFIPGLIWNSSLADLPLSSPANYSVLFPVESRFLLYICLSFFSCFLQLYITTICKVHRAGDLLSFVTFATANCIKKPFLLNNL